MTQNAIRIAHASVYLGGKEILHDLSWTLPRGDRCFLLGANGAGKTTLVKTIMGYAWPKFGAEMELLGHRFGQVDLTKLRKKVALVSPFLQQWSDPEITALQMVLSGFEGTLGFFRKPSAEEEAAAMETMAKLRCAHLRDQSLYTMSSGEQVKVLIARALLTKPELMILDEPSVYLDIAGREFLLGAIDDLAKNDPDLTILFITQRIEDILPVFRHGMILKGGRITAAGLREEVLTEQNLHTAFDLNIKLIRSGNGRLWSYIE